MTFVKTALFHKAGEGSGGGGDSHNLGYYETSEALRTAHPTATAGDFAIVNSTDTVWLWDADTSAWKDGDTKGQVTSVNNQTGAVVIPDELPSQTGKSGMFLTTDGTDASWTANIKVDLRNGDWYITANCQEFEVHDAYWGGVIKTRMLLPQPNYQGNSSLGGSYYNNTRRSYNRAYVENLNNGLQNAGDISVPAVAGEMAVIQVNTTITLTAAGWSSNTQTVNVTGMTATGVVMVSPDPTDQSAYTSAGILCTAQAAGTLTFTCDTVPSADIDVNVVCL